MQFLWRRPNPDRQFVDRSPQFDPRGLGPVSVREILHMSFVHQDYDLTLLVNVDEMAFRLALVPSPSRHASPT